MEDLVRDITFIYLTVDLEYLSASPSSSRQCMIAKALSSRSFAYMPLHSAATNNNYYFQQNQTF